MKVCGIQNKYCVQEKKAPCFLAVWNWDQGVCLWAEPFTNRGRLPVIQETFLMHSRCSSDLSKESSDGEDIFFSEHCKLTEDKQVSRSVGSSRKTDYFTGISQRFELRVVGYLPGASMGCAVGTHVCREFNGHRPDLELKKICRARMFRRASLGVSDRVMTLSVCCVLPTEQILASYGCFTLHCFTTGFFPCTGNISISK